MTLTRAIRFRRSISSLTALTYLTVVCIVISASSSLVRPIEGIGATALGPWQAGERPDSSCSNQSILNQTQGFSPALNVSQAAYDANTSSNYSSTASQLGPNVTITYDGVGAMGHVSMSSCSINFGNYLVAYELNFTNVSLNCPSGPNSPYGSNSPGTCNYPTGQLSIQVNTSSGAVVNTSISRMLMSTLTKQWAGWGVKTGNDSTIWASRATWSGFGSTAGGGYCGAATHAIGICGVSFWTGITDQPQGSNGIVQSGFDVDTLCVYFGVFLGYKCSTTYTGWIDFFTPNLPSPAIYDPALGIQAADTVKSEAGVWSGTVKGYFATTWDYSNMNIFFLIVPAYMSSINYGQFQAEEKTFPGIGTLPVPSFNFWFNPARVLGDPSDLVPLSFLFAAPNGAVTAGSMTYNANACALTYSSCFDIS